MGRIPRYEGRLGVDVAARYVWSFARFVWDTPEALFVLALALLLIIISGATGCGSGGSVAGPSSVSDLETPAPVLQLAAPPVLRGRWATGDGVALVPPSDNVVVLTPSYAQDEPEAIARELARRRLPVIVYAGHIYVHPRDRWSSSWARFDEYLQPLRDAGVLVGIQPLDEPRHLGQPWGSDANVAAAIDDVHGRGYRALLTEWAAQVWGPWSNRRPPGADWWAITCTPYPGTIWTAQRCGERLADSPDVDALVAPGFDPGTGLPNRAAWEAAAAGRGLLWWETAE